MLRIKAAYAVAQVGFLVVMIFLWQVLAQDGSIDANTTGTPSEIAATLGEWISSGSLWADIGATMLVLVLGYVVGILLGAILGVVSGVSRTARDILEPFIVFFNGMPRLILYPFIVIVLGFGLVSKVALVVLVIFVIVAVTISTGFAEVPDVLVANMRTLGASRWELIREVYLPSLAVWILSTSRTSLGYAFQAVIIAEFIGANVGLGYRVVAGQGRLDIDSIWAALAVIVVLAVVLDALLGRVEQRVTRWSPARSG